MKKYLIVNIVDSSNIPTLFSSEKWPLHLTLLMHFNTDKPVEHIVTELEKCTNKLKAFEVLVESESEFGPNLNVPASIIQASKELSELHANLMGVVKKLDATYDEPIYIGTGYRPHVTTQGGVKLSIGQTLLVDNVTLAERIEVPKGKLIKIVKTFGLKF